MARSLTWLAAWRTAHRAELPLKLPIAILKLLHLASQLPDLGLKPLDPQHLIRERLLLAGGLLAASLLTLRHRCLWPLENALEH